MSSGLPEGGAAAAASVGGSGAVAPGNNAELMAELGLPSADTSTESGQMRVGSQGSPTLSTLGNRTVGAKHTHLLRVTRSRMGFTEMIEQRIFRAGSEEFIVESVGEICYMVIDNFGTLGLERTFCLTNTHEDRLTQHKLPSF